MNDKTTLSADRVIPPALAKRGIRRVVDNLDGREIALPAGTLNLFFGEAVLKELARRRAAAPPAGRAKPHE